MSCLSSSTLVVFAALASFAACASRSTTSVQNGESIITIVQGSDFYTDDFEQETAVIINSLPELESLWGRVYSDHSAENDFPKVDFARESVVFVTSGVQSSGGYEVEVEAIEDVPEGVRIVVRTTSSGSECIVTQSLTSPIHIVRVRKLPGVVMFEWVPEVVEC